MSSSNVTLVFSLPRGAPLWSAGGPLPSGPVSSGGPLATAFRPHSQRIHPRTFLSPQGGSAEVRTDCCRSLGSPIRVQPPILLRAEPAVNSKQEVLRTSPPKRRRQSHTTLSARAAPAAGHERRGRGSRTARGPLLWPVPTKGRVMGLLFHSLRGSVALAPAGAAKEPGSMRPIREERECGLGCAARSGRYLARQ